jgi:4-hydroxy-3-methylbut-2-enyl diphosphate reductase IspH
VRRVGVTSGASTPTHSTRSGVAHLESLEAPAPV